MPLEIGRDYLTGWGQYRRFTGDCGGGVLNAGGEHHYAETGENVSRPGEYNRAVDDYALTPQAAAEFWTQRLIDLCAVNDARNLSYMAPFLANIASRAAWNAKGRPGGIWEPRP